MKDRVLSESVRSREDDDDDDVLNVEEDVCKGDFRVRRNVTENDLDKIRF